MSGFHSCDNSALSLFISYSWSKTLGRADDVRKLSDYLKRKKKLNAWIDLEEMHGSTVERMAEGIDSADVVIVFFSEAYQKSENCRREATYSDQQKKPILYVRMQQDYQLNGWLGFFIGDKLWVDYKKESPVDTIGDEIYRQAFQLFDSANKKKFRAVGIERELYSKQCFRNLDYQPKLVAIKKICHTATREGGLLVVTGDEGVGKTYFMSLLLLRPESRAFLTNEKECNVGTALWLNCYPWQDEHLFQSSQEAKQNFKGELVELFSAATKRGVGIPLEEHVRILKENLEAPPLVIFDDVFHLPLLAFIREQCKSLPCVAIIRSACVAEMQCRTRTMCTNDGGSALTPWDELAPQIEPVNPLKNDDILVMLRDTFELKDVSLADLRNMADACKGLPGKAYELSKKHRNKEEARFEAKRDIPRLNPAAIAMAFKNRLQSSVAQQENNVELPELKFIEVPDFDNYFVRAEEEDALRKGIRCLASKREGEKGCLVIEGCGGIGKSTLISHVLRDPKHKEYFQRTCNLHIFIWLNCYEWRDGIANSDEQKSNFFEKLLSLGSKVDANMKDGFKTLNQMLELFADKNQRILFLLDDVFHYSILDELRIECPSILCCAITRDSSVLAGPSFDPFLKLQDQQVPNPCRIGYLSEDRILEILMTDFKLKDKLRREQLLELAKRCGGMPLIVSLIGGQFRTSRDNQYQRTYKKLIEEGKFGSLKVGKTGRGEEKASQLFDVAWQSLTSEDRTRYYAFLLFNPVQEVTDKYLKVLWNCEDVEDVRDVCIAWERLSLVRRITRSWSENASESYLIHQILHESAVEKAAQDFHLEGGQSANKLLLSLLRLRILIQNKPQFDDDIANLLTTMRKLIPDYLLFYVLLLIENDALKQVLPSNCQLPCGLIPKDFEETLANTASSGHFYLTEYLISCGCNVNAKGRGFSTPLMKAAARGNLKIAELLISKGAEIDATDDFDQTALTFAAFYGQEKVAEFLISKGAQVDAAIRNGETGLMKAASQGHDKVVQLLIAKGAKVDETDNWGGTAFSKAAEHSHEKVMELLASKGANVDAKDHWGKTALMSLTWHGLHRAADLLISKGADVNATDNNKQTPLMNAALGGHEKMVNLLILRGANVNAVDKSGQTALFKAAERGHIKVMEILISKGADVDAADEEGSTPLLRAVFGGNMKAVELLISSGANLEKANKYGQTALWVTAYHDRFEMLQLLASKGANVNVNVANQTPLSRAVTFGYQHIVDYLISKGASVDVDGETGLELFFSAAWNGDVKMLELLISKGADVNAASEHGRTVLMQAAVGGHLEGVQLLLSKGAKVDPVDKDGQSALILAAWSGNCEVVDLIVSNGANLEAVDKNGITALLKAADCGASKVVELLLSKGANIDVVDNWGRTALIRAASQDFDKAFEVLVSNGANLDAKDSEGDTALIAALHRRYDEVAEFLISEGADVNLANNKGETALMMAARNGSIGIVELLVSNGAKLDHANENLETALAKAAACGKEDVVEFLLSKGAKTEVEGDNGATLLCAASAGGLFKLVEQLISDGTDVNATNNQCETALMKATANEQLKIVELLISHGARADLADKSGKTALMMAATCGLYQAIDILVANGADVNARDNEGEVALIKSVRRDIPKFVEVLVAKGADVDAKNSKGVTALIEAAATGCGRMVEVLIAKGANVNATTNIGKTALMWAASRGYEEIVKALLANDANTDARDNEGKTAFMLASENSHENVIKLLTS